MKVLINGGIMARVLISMSNDFLNKVDNIATSEQRTRSELIREALRIYIKRNKISNNLQAEANATMLTELLS
jgi:metal-responsive CopG/Arc/MetJ family transcriptional regulator